MVLRLFVLVLAGWAGLFASAFVAMVVYDGGLAIANMSGLYGGLVKFSVILMSLSSGTTSLVSIFLCLRRMALKYLAGS
jgi:hypothetical protein